MFREDYIRDMAQIGPDEEQMAQLLDVINNKEERSMKKRIFRTVALAAALCAALTATALAASPTLREALAEALGSFEPYSQTVEGVSAVDGGIELKVVSMLMDETDGTAYLQATDMEGDRLGERTRLAGDFGLSPIAYDGESKTALYRVSLRQALNELKRGNTEELELHFDRLYPDVVELPYEEMETQTSDGYTYCWWKGEAVIPAQFYHSAETLKSVYLKEEEVDGSSAYTCGQDPVLAPEQTPAQVGSEYFSLSSLGFDERGVLHVQLKLAQGVSLRHCSDIEIDILPGELLSDYGLNSGLHYHRVLFGEGRYLDVAFEEVDKALAARLPDSTIYGEVCTAPAIEGEWTLRLLFTPLPERTVALNNDLFCTRGLELKQAYLTAMGLRLETTLGSQKGYMGGIQSYLFCRDGSILPLKYWDEDWLYTGPSGEQARMESLSYEQRQGADGWRHTGCEYSWNYPEAVDPKDVVGFSWGMWYVPLNGEGESHWLDAVPRPTD